MNIPISSEVITQVARDLVTSQIAQAAAGTIVGLAIVASARQATDWISPMVANAWYRLRNMPPVIEVKVEKPAT